MYKPADGMASSYHHTTTPKPHHTTPHLCLCEDCSGVHCGAGWCGVVVWRCSVLVRPLPHPPSPASRLRWHSALVGGLTIPHHTTPPHHHTATTSHHHTTPSYSHHITTPHPRLRQNFAGVSGHGRGPHHPTSHQTTSPRTQDHIQPLHTHHIPPPHRNSINH